MRIHEVLIVPSAGYSAADGTYTRGLAFKNLSELDIVDNYVRSILDELDEASIRHRVLNVRMPPGVPEGLRHSGVQPNTLVLHCRVHWTTGKVISNKSRTFYGHGGISELAHVVSQSMSHWGHTYASFGHQAANPVQDLEDPLLCVTGASGIRVEPFAINGPNSQEYAAWLPQLGRDIGRAVADYVIAKDLAARCKPSQQAGKSVR